MKKITQITAIGSLAIVLAACGAQKKEGNAAINDTKAAIEKLKDEKNKKEFLESSILIVKPFHVPKIILRKNDR